jgi:sporulation protein YlmC with PRC-barrel domain
MVFARSLAKKTVLLSDGTVIGTVYNLTVDLRTGSLIDLLVKPQNDIPELKKNDGLYIIPFDSVKSISDYVVIDRKRLRSL